MARKRSTPKATCSAGHSVTCPTCREKEKYAKDRKFRERRKAARRKSYKKTKK